MKYLKAITVTGLLVLGPLLSRAQLVCQPVPGKISSLCVRRGPFLLRSADNQARTSIPEVRRPCNAGPTASRG